MEGERAVTSKQQLARETNRVIGELLRAEGYVPAGKSVGIWWKSIDGETMASITCVGLTTRYSPHVYVNPSYGLWFRPIHDLISTLIDPDAFRSHSTAFDRSPSVMRRLEARGHSSPRAERWEFASLAEAEDQLPELIAVLTTSGYAWAVERANLAAVTAELRAAPDIPSYAVWLPVALFLSGAYDEMSAHLDRVLAHYEGKGGAYLEHVRQLATALEQAARATYRDDA